MSPVIYMLYFTITIIGVIIALIRKRQKRESLPTIHKERECANTRKIFYLRSFNLDGIGLVAGNFDVFESLNIMPVELELANLLSPLKAHLITIGKPGEEIPEIGFDRKYFGDDEWQNAVLKYLSEAELIIFRPDSSDSVLWEFEQILHLSYQSKTIIWADMGYNTNYKLNKIRYRIFARKILEKQGIIVPDYNKWKIWLGIDESNNWAGFTFISSVPAYKAMIKD
ncbi:MAG: transferase [Mucilaginibacter sp.]|nr:transferase [Mucilaginibacter sp.]